MSASPAAISRPLRLKVRGEWACFTRPEMKVERVSYDVMTPSAARGVLEAILWKPAIRWQVERIDVLNPIRTETIRRNEVGAKASIDGLLAGGRSIPGIDAVAARQQRASVVLRDVAYVIHARIAMTAKAGPDDNLTKFVEMFRRRAGSGQCFQRPYLGTREFAADFELIPDGVDGPPPAGLDRPLGWMLYDIDHAGGRAVPMFFEARLDQGTLVVPAPDSPEVRR